MRDGFIKAAAGIPEIRVADCAYNGEQIVSLMEQAAARGVRVLALPELCITGSTCGDLYWQDTLLRGAQAGLGYILDKTAGLDLVAAVGLPVRDPRDSRLYSCAALIHKGQLLGLTPKSRVSGSQARWFASGGEADASVELCGQSVRLSGHMTWACRTMPELVIGVELGEALGEGDILVRAGATLILNPAAGPAGAGGADWRRRLVEIQSGRLVCGYVFANAGPGESTTDLVFDGHSVIAENGALLAQRRFEGGLTVSEIDVGRLSYERCRLQRPAAADRDAPGEACPGNRGSFSLERLDTPLTRPVSPAPFVPAEGLAERCEEVLTLAALGLKKRLEHTNDPCAVIGLSGGLDSTLAILITARAFDLLGRNRKDILAVTMPCFGTTGRTRSNAELLAEELGTGFREVNIGPAVRQHFADIGQDMDDHSVTFENAQARERTQVLMDLANKLGGMVIGTGDLSELALGWATYSGDHMSMYGVNASIPKTLIRHLVAHVAGEQAEKSPRLSAVLQDILATPVSPELLPPENGEITQKTEDLVGPYELHDFFLYYAVRWGFSPRKVLRLAEYAMEGRYDRETLLKWLDRFYCRFFTQQFKRSCLPDGPGVGSLTLSPRGGWNMPSDAVAALWRKELGELAG